ncbi:hypothetical protein BHE74_00021972 [Ensete ventricosum]|nr:hypothetical protein BHE74_00021972 [Ensete ventricosum]
MIPSGFSPRSGRKSSAKDADAERNRPFLDRTEEEEQKRGFQEVLVVKAEEEEKRDLGEGLREPLRKRVPWEEMLLQAMIDLQTTRGKSQDEETLSGRGRGLDRCTRDHRKSTVQVNRWCVRWPVEIIGSTPTDGIGSPSLTCARATFMWARKEFGFAFFWLLVERPTTIVPEMLQRANQYVTAETLVVGRCEDHKRPRMVQFRGQSSGPPGGKVDRPEPSLPMPPQTSLSSSRMKIFLQIKERGLLMEPNQMKTPHEHRDQSKYCQFYQDYGHDIEECHDLRNQIEELIYRGHLGCYIRRLHEPSPHP